MTNKFSNINFIIGKQNYKQMYDQIKSALVSHPKIFSFIIYNSCSDKVSEKSVWFVSCTISNREEFNTLDTKKICNDIITIIMEDDFTSPIAGFRQPSVELSFEIFTPMLKSLSQYFCNRWSILEYDDVFQICSLCFFKLYKNGYYLHKKLIIKSVSNYIHRKCLKHINDVSIHDCINRESNGTHLEYMDTLVDVNESYKVDDLIDKLSSNEDYRATKTLLINRIGTERYKRLQDAYNSDDSTSHIRHEVYRIKKYLQSIDLKNSFTGTDEHE